MLITAKRSPTINGAGQAASALSLTRMSAKPKLHSFFQRSFTTEPRQNRVIFNQVATVMKYSPAKETRAAPVTVLKLYNNIKRRAVTKTLARYLSENKTENEGAVDVRLSRQKSGRNGEYIERMANHIGSISEKISLNLNAFRTKYRENQQSTEPTTRQLQCKKRSSNDFLIKIRDQIVSRRTPTFVKNIKTAAEHALIPTEQKRLQWGSPKIRSRGYKQHLVQKNVNALATNRQNVLHARNASNRKNRLGEVKTVVIPARMFQVKQQLRLRAKRRGLGKRIAGRFAEQ
jgi:hypothetical protein